MVTVKLFFGISYLSMPNTFAHCGILGGPILFTIVIGMNGITMMQLIRTSERHHGVTSYSDLGQRVLGPNGKQLIDVCVLIKQIGACISYLYFVSTLLDFAVCQSTGTTCYGNRTYMIMLIIPVIIMSAGNSYKFLSLLSIPSIMIAILGMICIFFYAFGELTQGRTSHSDLKYFDLESILGRIGLAMYIFDGNAIVVNIRAEAREKKAKYPQILSRAIIFTLSLFIVFSTICYYVYREHSAPIFTMSFAPMNSLIMFILCCVCINAMTSYPVQMLAAFNILEKFEVLQIAPVQSGASVEVKNRHAKKEFMRKMIIRSTVIILTTLVGASVKTFTDFINIAGAIGSVTVAFVLPEVLYLREFGDKISTAKRIGCYFIAIFGVIGSTYSIYFSVRKMVQGDFS
ncbi:hypothetical protein FGO68_gene802 [Halteria grandinella]|uniref:Amino acid transporter transmembrane domain-containing protein n=1 Tax=Halteria grandinella TaxID=5974 RepID=A0A8J8NPV2_HALGN|nr:hypothetical protein FGO68_gene802 [Halteria grandinella]